MTELDRIEIRRCVDKYYGSPEYDRRILQIYNRVLGRGDGKKPPTEEDYARAVQPDGEVNL